MQRKVRTFSADFETTVYTGQKRTDVWAAASVELGTEDVQIFHTIGDLYRYYVKLNANCIVYFHNLKFDGMFWLSYLINDLQFQQASVKLDEEGKNVSWVKRHEMPNNSFEYCISDMGQWYTITIKCSNGKTIELRDSLKLLPFKLEVIGKAFKTKHQKLSMEYTGYRYPGCRIADEEKKYIANDVLVIKEALEIMFQQGHDKLTIGSCCLAEYKKLFDKQEWTTFFPNLYEIELDSNTFGYKTAGEYIHKSYKGGWCYLVKGKENRVYNNGTTADVNSLYPSVMHSESGDYYPIGRPTFYSCKNDSEDIRYNPWWFNKEQCNEVDNSGGKYKGAGWNNTSGYFYFFRIKTRFYIKKGKLPFVQIKGTWMYKGTEALESSDIIDKHGIPHSEYVGVDGELHDTRVELVLTQTDFILLREHYKFVDYELLDYCVFNSVKGIFDEYIDKYAEIKKNSTGAMRTEAKLFLNNLYGKMASSTESSFKVAYAKEDSTIGFYDVREYEKEPGYIAVGSAVTSYARNFTIRAAQQNFYGKDKPGFIYADTDSIHCDLPADEIKGITVHPVNFCCWKLESSWDIGWFSRQKTYIEHVVAEDLKPIDTPFYSVKCAGMPERCKQLFIESFNPEVANAISNGLNPRNISQQLCDSGLSPEEIEFLSETRTIDDFTIGLTVPGKLRPKRIPGGVILEDSFFTMR